MASLTKPARLQVDPDSINDDDKPPQTGHTFNIWYLKWAGGDLSARNYVKLKFRVNIANDSGFTRARDHDSPICFFFAKGCCYKGKECPFLHRLPQVTDRSLPAQDCFGRDKTADYRDDMGGVGLMTKSNRTLYVGGLHVSEDIDDVVSRHFLEFGTIARLRVVKAKSCAFVTFQSEAQAQFAKEAMDLQSLDGSEVLSVKWANDDPNPASQETHKRELEDVAMETVRKLLKSEQHTALGLITAELAPKTSKLAEPAQSPSPGEDVEHDSGGIFDRSRVAALNKLADSKPPTSHKPLKLAILAKPAPMAIVAGYSSDEE